MEFRHPPTKDDRAEIAVLKAEPWMLGLLKANPPYLSWGPYEDYMCDANGGWGAPVFVKDWKGRFDLDDLNEAVNFYFSVRRDSKPCERCDGTGLNPATKNVADNFYPRGAGDKDRPLVVLPGAPPGWSDAVTDDEAVELVRAGRFPNGTTAAQINAEGRHPVLGHDAVNRNILVRARAKRLGVWGLCPHCDEGEAFTEQKAHVALTLWVIHPRKGASRAWEFRRIEREDLPSVRAFLRQAAKRNASRFSRIGRIGGTHGKAA